MRPHTSRTLSRLHLPSLLTFVALALGLAWLVALPAWIVLGGDPTGASSSLSPMITTLLVQAVAIAMMMTPGIAAIVCSLIWPRVRVGLAGPTVDRHPSDLPLTHVTPAGGEVSAHARAEGEASTHSSAEHEASAHASAEAGVSDRAHEATWGGKARTLVRDLGLWPLTRGRGMWRMILLAYAGFFAFYLVHPFIAAALGLYTLDLENLSMFRAQMDVPASGGVPSAPPMMDPGTLKVLLGVQVLLTPLIALLNLGPALGEELGWRGFLVERLLPLGTWPALLIHGAIWGVWHAPLTLLGHNYGLYDWRGVALMTIACTIFGVALGWMRLATHSVWPPTFAHAMLNAMGGLVLLLGSYNDPPNLVIAGPLGVVAWGMMVLVIAAGAMYLSRSSRR